MCYPITARPPHPPIAGGAGDVVGRELVLEASDGNRFDAFSSRARSVDAPGIMILPDVRGLHPFFKELTVRFAEAGVHATAMDFYGRTAGLGERGEDFDAMTHVQQLTPDGIGTDSEATLAHLRSAEGGAPVRTYSLGFCMGGRISFNQAWRDHGLSGVIGFYGGLAARGDDDEFAPLKLAPEYKCPVLGLFGGADTHIPAEDIELFGRTLDEAGVQNEMVVYDGAPHSFFDRTFAEHREACDDAWMRMLRFVGA